MVAFFSLQSPTQQAGERVRRSARGVPRTSGCALRGLRVRALLSPVKSLTAQLLDAIRVERVEGLGVARHSRNGGVGGQCGQMLPARARPGIESPSAEKASSAARIRSRCSSRSRLSCAFPLMRARGPMPR